MLKFIKNIFNSTDALTEAGRSGNCQEFVRLFLAAELNLLSLPIADSLEADDTTEKEILDLVERAARRTAEQTEIVPFTFHEDEKTILPVFTDDKSAQKFVEQYAIQVKKIIPFEVFTLKGEVLLDFLSENYNVVLNPKNATEYRLTEKDLEILLRQRT